MKFTTATILFLAPLAATAWLSPFGLMRRPLVVYSPEKMFEKQQALINRAFTQTSPRYEITSDDDKFEVAIDAPGFKPEDVQVTVEDNGHVLCISGSRENSGDTYSFSSQFSQSFSLGPAVEADKFTANLKDGVLIVTAPKDLKKIEASVRNIPITQHQLEESKTPAKEVKIEEEAAVDV